MKNCRLQFQKKKRGLPTFYFLKSGILFQIVDSLLLGLLDGRIQAKHKIPDLKKQKKWSGWA